MSEGPIEIGAVPGTYLGDTNYFRRAIPALGVLIILVAVVKFAVTFSGGGILLEAILDLLLISSVGIVLLFVRVWLPNTGIQREFYPRIAMWVLAGIGVMAIVLVLRVIHPGVTVEYTFGTQAVLLSIGSIAGLGIGVHEAQALTYARKLELQNEKLKRTEGRLEEAVTQLEASNERLEQFAYAASHDLQEPLRMVTSYIGLLENRYVDELDEDGREFIEFAVDGAERMRETIDGLLQYSRVEAQGDDFDPVDLDDVLDDVLADLQFKTEEAAVEMTRDPLPTVKGDEIQLRQVFQNLVTNAIDYSGDSRPRIHVSAERDGQQWAISVRDEGIGIDAGDADRVFDIFERLHSADDQAGSGMGLALCQRIVERHDGEIWVDSETGAGSTFIFTLAPAEDQ